jgi:hypothetical protein
MITVLFWIGIPVTLMLGNVLGWRITIASKGYPFNWRVFIGPWSYVKWLRRNGYEIL